MPLQGYQLVGPGTEVEGEPTAVDLKLLLAPHQASTEGRVALESLQCERVATARTTFQQPIQHHPGDAAYQIGLPEACVMQFEASRTDPAPDHNGARVQRRDWTLHGEPYPRSNRSVGD